MAWWQRQHGMTTRGRLVALLRRTESTVDELAEALGLTDNAVRAQLSALERDGVVRPVGTRRDGAVGKPATMYGIAPASGSLFSSAYAPLLAAVLAELATRLSAREMRSLLRGAGHRLAPSGPATGSFDERARAAATLLTDLGADVELARTEDGYAIRGFGCPVSDAVSACAATCTAVEALLGDVSGTTVRQHCDRSDQPRCHFLIHSPRS